MPRTRQLVTEYFRVIHRHYKPRTDCRGCTQKTCSDPDNSKGQYHACYGWIRGLIARLNAADHMAEAKTLPHPEYSHRLAVTALMPELDAPIHSRDKGLRLLKTMQGEA